MPHNQNFESFDEDRYRKTKPRSVGKRPAIMKPAKPAKIELDVPKPIAHTFDISNMIGDLSDIEKLRADRYLLHKLLNRDEYDVGAMEPTEILEYRKLFSPVYQGLDALSNGLHILEIIAMANVRMDLLTQEIATLLRDFKDTFGFQIVDDWER